MHLPRTENMVTLQGVSIAVWRVRCIWGKKPRNRKEMVVSIAEWRVRCISLWVCRYNPETSFNRRVACEMHQARQMDGER